MAYEYEESNKQIIFTVDNESSMDELNERIKELEEVYRKAKALDKIREFVTKRLKDEEEKPHALLGDYEYGLCQSYNNVDDIIQEHLERVDDER